MKRRTSVFRIIPATASSFSFILLLSWGTYLNAQQPSNKPLAVVHADKTGAPIKPHNYGMFTELLSNMYEKGLWAEMISDRKFFYPVNSNNTLVPVNTKRNFNRWRPVGPDDVVVMDKNKAYVGEHSPLIKLDGITTHGIQQSGMALRKGKTYTGRVILSGDPGTE